MAPTATMRRFAGVTLIAGSVLFFIGGVMPAVSHVFRTNDHLRRLRYVEEDPATWDLGNALFAAGGLTAAIGLVPLARSVRRVTYRRILVGVAYGAAALALVGAVSWLIICYLRITRSPYDVVFVDISPWLWGTYGFFTQTAFIVFGVVLLLSGYPKWLGWVLIVLGAVICAAFLAMGGLVPAVHYVVFLILGVTLITLRPRRWEQSLDSAHENESRT